MQNFSILLIALDKTLVLMFAQEMSKAWLSQCGDAVLALTLPDASERHVKAIQDVGFALQCDWVFYCVRMHHMISRSCLSHSQNGVALWEKTAA